MSLETLRTAIVKITAYPAPFDWKQPYNKNLGGSPGSGTGFVAENVKSTNREELYIVTAYHVVSFSARILVELSDAHHSGGPVEARMVAYSASLDVAIIAADIPMPPWLVPLPMGNSDNLKPNSEVQAAGFPLRKGFQMTTGYVSGRLPNQVQIDAAVNPGNSGGPLILVESSEVVAVVIAQIAPDAAQNVNFASPLEEMKKALLPRLEREPEKMTSVPQISLNLELARTDPDLRQTYDESEHGAYISFVHPKSQLHKKGVTVGDLLMEVDKVAVDMRGNVRVKWWLYEALSVDTLFARMTDKQRYRVTVMKPSGKMIQDVELEAEADLNTYRDIDAESEEVQYSVKGGLVVQPLSHNLMEADKWLQHRYWYVMKRPELRASSLLVVTYVMPESPFTTMSTIQAGDVIVKVGNKPVRTLKEYEAAFDTQGELVVLHTYLGAVSCATRKNINSVLEKIEEKVRPLNRKV